MHKVALLLSFSILLIFSACRKIEKNETIEVTEKIIPLNSTFSEILYGLGLGKNLVAVDTTSNFPDSVKLIPHIGNARNLDIENVISLKPNRVMVFEHILKPEIAIQLQNSAIQTDIFPELKSIKDTKKLITQLADSFHRKEKGMALIQQIDEDLKDLKKYDIKPKVLFIYVQGTDSIWVAGKNTAMYEMIKLAGGENIVADFEGYQLLNAAFLETANPDAILLFTNGFERIGGLEGIKQVPGITLTNAGKHNTIITMDEQYISGFGVRIGMAVVDLNKKFSSIEVSPKTQTK